MTSLDQQISQLRTLYAEGRFDEVESSAMELISSSNHPVAWNALVTVQAQSGRLEEAYKSAKEALLSIPDDAQIHVNLGNVLLQRGLSDEACSEWNRALALNPRHVDALCNLSETLISKSDYVDAESFLSSALDIAPNNQRALLGLGRIFTISGRSEQAVEVYMKLALLIPDSVDAHILLGVSLHDSNRYEQACESFERAIQLEPLSAEAWSNLGASKECLGDFQQAEISYFEAVKISPDHMNALGNLAGLLAKLGRLTEACFYYEKAIMQSPGSVEHLHNLAVILVELGELKRACLLFEKAAPLTKDKATLLCDWGVCLRQSGNWSEASARLNEAIALHPDYAPAHYNLSLVLWSQNRFNEAFIEYEWRWLALQSIGSEFLSSRPCWSGEAERSVLIWREQGLGDEIMFFSVLREMHSRCSRLIVECDYRLIPIFQRSLPHDITYILDRNAVSESLFDYQISAGKAFGLLRQTIEDFSSTAEGYLLADYEKSLTMSESRGRVVEVIRIGISWTTASIQGFARYRSIPLLDLSSALAMPEIQLINLQYGEVADELLEVETSLGTHILESLNLDKMNDVDGLASLISSCDLVVTIDNVTANLAGALGVETRVLLPKTADPRWSLDVSESHLYNSVHLYRQKNLGDWREPLEALRSDIEAVIHQKIVDD